MLNVVFFLSCPPLSCAVFSAAFDVPQAQHKLDMDDIKGSILEGTANWAAKIAITGNKTTGCGFCANNHKFGDTFIVVLRNNTILT